MTILTLTSRILLRRTDEAGTLKPGLIHYIVISAFWAKFKHAFHFV